MHAALADERLPEYGGWMQQPRWYTQWRQAVRYRDVGLIGEETQSAEGERGLSKLIQDFNLTLEFVRRPDVIGIKKRDVFAARVREAEIPGHTHPKVCVTRMLQVFDLSGPAFRVLLSHCRAAISRPVINQQ